MEREGKPTECVGLDGNLPRGFGGEFFVNYSQLESNFREPEPDQRFYFTDEEFSAFESREPLTILSNTEPQQGHNADPESAAAAQLGGSCE